MKSGERLVHRSRGEARSILKRDNLTLLGRVTRKWRQRGSKMAERVAANRFAKLDAFLVLCVDIYSRSRRDLFPFALCVYSELKRNTVSGLANLFAEILRLRSLLCAICSRRGNSRSFRNIVCRLIIYI